MTIVREEQRQSVRGFRLGSGKLVVSLLMALYWSALAFFRTESAALRLCTVILWGIAILLMVSERFGWSLDGHPWIKKLLTIPLIVCGSIYAVLGTQPANAGFFGPMGVILIFAGLFILGWATWAFCLLGSIYWCSFVFSHTENIALRICAVMVAVAATILIAMYKLGWSTDDHPRLGKVLAIIFLACGGVFVGLGPRQQDLWYFGLVGIILLLIGLLFLVLSSREYVAAGKRAREIVS